MEKVAFGKLPPLGAVQGAASHFASGVGRAMFGGAQTAMAAAVVGAGTVGASKVFDALTKGRDFNQMMKSHFNADLHEVRQQNPEAFNEAFTNLRAVNPDLSKNPMVAGTYMRRMFSFDPASAGSILVEAKSQGEKQRNMGLEHALRGGEMGIGHAYSEMLRDQGELEKEHRRPDLERKILEKTEPIRFDTMGGLEMLKGRLGVIGDIEREGRQPDLQKRILEQTEPVRYNTAAGLELLKGRTRVVSDVEKEKALKKRSLGSYAPRDPHRP